MVNLKHGCEGFPALRQNRIVVGVCVTALLLLVLPAGCQHARVSQRPKPPEAVSTALTPLPSPAAAAAAASAQQESDQPVSHVADFGTRPEIDGGEEIAEAGGVVAVAAETAVAQSEKGSQEPELLPLPERVTEPLPSEVPSPPPANAMSLTLQQALATGLAQNPDLVTLRGQVNVNRAMVDVADTPIWNPFVQAQLLPQGSPHDPGTGPGTGAGKTNYYVWAMQRFELAHQRRYRTESALAALNQVQWNIFQAELLNVSQSAALYFTALYQKELHDLTAANLELNNHLLGVMERRQQAGLAAPHDVSTARIAVRQSRRQLDLAEANYEAALLALRQQLNLPMDTPLSVTERLGDLQWSPVRGEGQFVDSASLARDVVEGRPDVMAARVGINVAQANWMLARAARVPDIQAGPIYDTSDAGTSFLGLRLQMDIPVMNTGAALEHQRCAEMSQQSLTYCQLKIKAAQQAHAAIDQYERVRLLAGSGPGDRATATSELADVLRLFDAGQADMLAVIATQNNLLQERRIDLDVLNQLAQSAAIVVQATGLPIDRLVGVRAPNPTPATVPQEG